MERNLSITRLLAGSLALILASVGCDSGKDDSTSGAAPAPVTLTEKTLGNAHSCALIDKRAYCWGTNNNGQLGDGRLIDVPPTMVLSGVEDIAGEASTPVPLKIKRFCVGGWVKMGTR